MNKFPLALLTGLLAVATSAFADTTINFNSQATFNTQFPTSQQSNETTTQTNPPATNSTVSLTTVSGSSAVDLHAEQGAAETSAARETIYSDPSLSSNFDFVASPKTFTFSNVGFNGAAGKTTYTGVLGLTSTAYNGGATATAGAADSFLFVIDRGGGRVRFEELINGAPTILAQFGNPGNTGSNLLTDYSFTSMAMTLSATNYSIALTDTTGQQFSAAGALAARLTEANFPVYDLALESQMTLSGATDTTRQLDLTVTGISVTAVPEPRTATAALLCVAVAAWTTIRRRARA